MKASLKDGGISKVQPSVIKAAEARVKRAEHRLERDDDSRAADYDSDAGSKMSRAKATQTELAARNRSRTVCIDCTSRSKGSFSCKDAVHQLNYLRSMMYS